VPVTDPTVKAIESNLAFDLRASWQSRALAATRRQHVGAVLLSVLAHNFDDALETLLKVTFPGFTSITAPFLSTAGKVAKIGAVVADIVNKDGTITKDAVIYRDETALRDDFRRLADRLKLSDSDRIEMFKCVQRWVVADRRLDPTFDPKDPDAKRLLN
jgi:hypothetical protein